MTRADGARLAAMACIVLADCMPDWRDWDCDQWDMNSAALGRRTCKAGATRSTAVAWRSTCATLGACIALQGCSFVGAVAGAAIQRHEQVDDPSALRMGEPVRAKLREPDGASDRAPRRPPNQGQQLYQPWRGEDQPPRPYARGDYAGAPGGSLQLADDDGALRRIPLDRIETIERVTGTYSLELALVGLVVDIAFAAAVLPGLASW